ncbi:GIY-YIG nuclease family protein [Flavobacterium suzhouense]|uniref:GIY-YIG nuclease family protein n=1 Tax=Flavobacterium suzhouense TaxID=1529638 RepID=A0ABW5NRD9_9FLAO
MEFVVYILFSEKHNTTYTGYTSDLISRFKSHNELATKGHTIKFRPWVVIHLEVYHDKKSAMNREKYLKTGAGRDFIKTLLP